MVKNLEVAAGTEWEAVEWSSSDDGEKGGVLADNGKKYNLPAFRRTSMPTSSITRD